MWINQTLFPKRQFLVFETPQHIGGILNLLYWRDNPPRHEYNIKGSHHLNSIVILKVLELKSNMYAAIVVFFASIVGVNSLSIHKRSCSVTIDSDFAVNKVRHIFSYLFFFLMFEKLYWLSNVHMDCSITCNSNETFSLKKICKMQNKKFTIPGGERI